MLIRFRNGKVPIAVNRDQVTRVSACDDGNNNISDDGAFIHVGNDDAVYVSGTFDDVCKSIDLAVAQGTCK